MRPRLGGSLGELRIERQTCFRIDRAAASMVGPCSTSRPARMIHITTCRDCKRGWQDGAGVRVELHRAALELAQCDAIIVDDETGVRAHSEIPPATRQQLPTFVSGDEVRR